MATHEPKPMRRSRSLPAQTHVSIPSCMSNVNSILSLGYISIFLLYICRKENPLSYGDPDLITTYTYTHSFLPDLS